MLFGASADVFCCAVSCSVALVHIAKGGDDSSPAAAAALTALAGTPCALLLLCASDESVRGTAAAAQAVNRNSSTQAGQAGWYGVEQMH